MIREVGEGARGPRVVWPAEERERRARAVEGRWWWPAQRRARALEDGGRTERCVIRRDSGQ